MMLNNGAREAKKRLISCNKAIRLLTASQSAVIFFFFSVCSSAIHMLSKGRQEMYRIWRDGEKSLRAHRPTKGHTRKPDTVTVRKGMP